MSLEFRKIEQKIDDLHTNVYEHYRNFPLFFLKLFLYSFVGLFIGRLIEYSISAIHVSNRLNSLLSIVLQLCLIFLLFFITFHAFKFYKVLKFDDWLMNTFEGFFFALLFTSTQTSLANNAKTLLF